MSSIQDEINEEDLDTIIYTFIFVLSCICGITICVWLIYRRAMCEEDDRQRVMRNNRIHIDDSDLP
jgi:hypothetical protein